MGSIFDDDMDISDWKKFFSANKRIIEVYDGLPTTAKKDYLVVTGDRNTKGKRDYTGAFRPEAIHFCETHKLDPKKVVRINTTLSRYHMAAELIDVVEKRQPKILAIFCHGYTHGIQLGIRSPKHKRATAKDKKMYLDFTQAMGLKHLNPTIALYACSTGNDPDDEDTAPGSGDDSFADLLRDSLCDTGAVNCRVFAHTTAGHTTTNPYIKFFDGLGSYYGGVGANFVAKPGTPEFKILGKMLRKDPEFRFRIPFMSIRHIHEAMYSY